MQRAAEYLRSLRQEKGFTIEEVSKRTKMSPSVIRALEDGRLDNIDPVYLKGFLKLYCRFLEIDWDSFQKEYLDFLSAQTNRPMFVKQPAAHPKKDSPPAGAAVALKFEKIKSSYSKLFSEYRTGIIRGLVVVAALILAVFLFKGCQAILKRIPKPAEKSAPASRGVSSVPSKKPFSFGIKKQEAQGKDEQPARKDASVKMLTLGVLAKEDSYIKVRVDGKELYRGTLHKGKMESYSGKEKIELIAGNAAALELEANGQRISSLGKRNEQIKKILTSEGLRSF